MSVFLLLVQQRQTVFVGNSVAKSVGESLLQGNVLFSVKCTISSAEGDPPFIADTITSLLIVSK